MNKILNILLIGLIIIVFVVLFYLAIPKYQIQSVKIDENYILITRLNTFTGEVAIRYQKYTQSEHLPEPRSNKLKFIEPIEPGFF